MLVLVVVVVVVVVEGRGSADWHGSVCRMVTVATDSLVCGERLECRPGPPFVSYKDCVVLLTARTVHYETVHTAHGGPGLAL